MEYCYVQRILELIPMDTEGWLHLKNMTASTLDSPTSFRLLLSSPPFSSLLPFLPLSSPLLLSLLPFPPPPLFFLVFFFLQQDLYSPSLFRGLELSNQADLNISAS